MKCRRRRYTGHKLTERHIMEGRLFGQFTQMVIRMNELLRYQRTNFTRIFIREIIKPLGAVLLMHRGLGSGA